MNSWSAGDGVTVRLSAGPGPADNRCPATRDRPSQLRWGRPCPSAHRPSSQGGLLSSPADQTVIGAGRPCLITSQMGAPPPTARKASCYRLTRGHSNSDRHSADRICPIARARNGASVYLAVRCPGASQTPPARHTRLPRGNCRFCSLHARWICAFRSFRSIWRIIGLEDKKASRHASAAGGGSAAARRRRSAVSCAGAVRRPHFLSARRRHDCCCQPPALCDGAAAEGSPRGKVTPRRTVGWSRDGAVRPVTV